MEQHAAYLGKDGLVKVETSTVLGELAKSVGQARRAYLRFKAEGKGSGHQPDYYDVRDQRFLGDKGIDERIQGDREIEGPGQRRSFQSCCV
jgi:hypothetical protein